MDHDDPHGLAAFIREVDDWPEPGVSFKDLTPLWADARTFAVAIDQLADHFVGRGIVKVVGMEARGFVVASPVAHRLGAGFVPVRKPDKLPWDTHVEHYELEYGSDHLEIHRDAIAPGERVLIVDDVIATGGTAAATIQLVEALGGHVVGLGFIVELVFLDGATALGSHEHHSLVSYR
ncbi:MAG: adenine phosphoribosyltransferase [Microthrixaceae bacterium]